MKPPMFTLNPAVTSLEEEGAFAVLEQALALKAEGRPVINLGIGQPDFSPPAHILQAAQKAARDGPHGYGPPMGLTALREAVAARLAARCNIAVDAGQVVIVPGGKVTIHFACYLFGGADAEILYPDPGFPSYREAIKSVGARPVAYGLREDCGFNLDADDIARLITPATRLIIINSPANPTGGVIDRATLARLVAVLADHPQVAILSDEIYSYFAFGDSEFVSLATFPELAERLIVLDGWSKTFAMTGWRLGYGVWPQALIPHVRKIISVTHSCVNTVAQMAGLAALTGPWDEIAAFRRRFAERRDLMVRGLNALPGVACQPPGGAFYAFPNITQTGLDSGVLAERLLHEAHVAVVAGENFGRQGNGFLRLSFAASLTELEEALARIDRFLRRRPNAS